MTINCIIVDDEPLAQQVIEGYIAKIPHLNLLAKCSTSFEAMDAIRNQKVDLVFLDIHMPNVSGIDFIKSLEKKPNFVFTTAYSEYALEAFDLNALDYLVKPIPFDRFLKMINKVSDYLNPRIENEKGVSSLSSKNKQIDYFFVKADYKEKKINYADVLYIEGLKDYVKIHLVSNPKPLITHSSLKKIANMLSEHGFVRVHRSFIVSINHIKSITKNRIVINDQWIPIGENFKEDFVRKVKNQ